MTEDAPALCRSGQSPWPPLGPETCLAPCFALKENVKMSVDLHVTKQAGPFSQFECNTAHISSIDRHFGARIYQ